MVIQIAYTNSNCSDLWNMFIKQNKKHTNIPLYMISDAIPENQNYDDILLYENSEPYYKVWINAINKFDSDYFIYFQEDFILYDNVNNEKIDEYVQFLNNNPQYSFVRLLKSGSLGNKRSSPTLYEIESTNPNIFSMQATIWRSIDYVKLLNCVGGKEWWEYDDYRNYMIDLNMMGVYHHDNEIKAGNNHYNSNVYPYLATALVKGKWNMREYGSYLNKMLIENNIDYNVRGIL